MAPAPGAPAVSPPGHAPVNEACLKVFAGTPIRCYDIAPNGERFCAIQKETPSPLPVVTHINLVQNWLTELQAKVPGEHRKQ